MTSPSVTIAGLNYSPEMTGIAPYTAELAAGLANQDFEIRVVAAQPHYPQWSYPTAAPGVAEGHEDGVTIVRVAPRLPSGGSSLSRLRFEIDFGLRAGSHLGREADAVIVVSPALFGSWAVLQRRRMLKGAKIGLIVQDLYTLGLQETGAGGGLSLRLTRYVEGSVLRRVDAIAVIHDRFRDCSHPRVRCAA